MSCGGRVYKGGALNLTLSFPYGDMDNIDVVIYTTGDYAAEKTASSVDGEINITLTKEELDLLPEGVIRYIIKWNEYSEAGDTPNYLKTPAGYSAVTPDEIYQEGYEQGVTDTELHLVPLTATTNGIYTPQGEDKGYNSVKVNVPVEGYLDKGELGVGAHWNGDTTLAASASNLDGFTEFRVYDAGYGESKYQSGYTAGYGDKICSGYSFILEGTITFEEDTYIDTNFMIGIFYHQAYNPQVEYTINTAYMLLDNRPFDDIRYAGETLTAGTYQFSAAIMEFDNHAYDDFYYDEPTCWRNDSPPLTGITFNTRIIFSKYPR